MHSDVPPEFQGEAWWEVRWLLSDSRRRRLQVSYAAPLGHTTRPCLVPRPSSGLKAKTGAGRSCCGCVCLWVWVWVGGGEKSDWPPGWKYCSRVERNLTCQHLHVCAAQRSEKKAADLSCWPTPSLMIDTG